ncbi:MAG: hypothetical protein LBR61_06675 [Synergistaceae bacterium]|nr:hypothetical protein [Synergistaceae bacterium]
MQIVAFPMSITYHTDSEDKDRFHRELSAIGLAGEQNTERDRVLLRGRVRDVIKREVQIGDKKSDFFDVTVETPMGTIELAHTLDFVDPDQRDLVKCGSYVEAICVLSGDVAVKKYQEGAVYDEENDLRLLRSCLKYGDFERLEGALSDACVYLKDEIKIEGKNEIIARLKDDLRQMSGGEMPYASYLAVVSKIERDFRDSAKYGMDKRCLALASEQYYAWLFITTDEGRIAEIEIVAGEKNHYRVRTDQSGQHAASSLWIEREKNDWLRLIKDCYEHLNFDADDFYYGMVPGITLKLQWEFEEIQGREKICRYFADEADKIKKAGITPAGEIVELSKWPYRSALLVTAGERKTLISIERGRQNSIGRIEIGMKDSLKVRYETQPEAGELPAEEKAGNPMRFIYEDWQAEEATRGTALKQHVRLLKARLRGTRITGTCTTGCSFCANEGKEDKETWNEWRMDSAGFDAPFRVDFGETRLKLHFGASSRVKLNLSDRLDLSDSREEDAGACHKVDFPNVTGQVLKDIVVTTSDVPEEDDYADEGNYIENLFFIMKNGFALCFFGRGGKTYVCERPVDALRLYPTDASVYITSDKYREGLKCSPSIAFVPCSFSEPDPKFEPWSCNDKIPDSDALHVLESSFDVLCFAIHYVVPEFDIYDSILVPIDKFREIVKVWGSIFNCVTLNTMFERLCGVDYSRRGVENKDFLRMFNSMGRRVWEKRDAERPVYDDFVVWFDKLSEKCTHIKIMGL